MPVKAGLKLSTVSYIILYVKDTEKTLPFYRDVLGMRIKNSEPGWVEFEAGGLTLALHGIKKHDGEKVSINHGEGQPIVVFTVNNVHDAYETLKTRGVKFTDGPQQVCEEGDKVGLSADFTDPDGNNLSIFSMIRK